jgi:metallo-beta-lactamase family protein
MKLSFHGAAQDVTGSCHLLQCAGKRILVDCGMYQGSRELVEDNASDFGFDPASVDYLLLTHAHLDHCGRIPLLVNRGFTGEIITTAASRELAGLVMMDSAGLQEEEARYRNRRARRRGKKGEEVVPLYTTLDALNALENFRRVAHYDQPLQLAPGIRATFIDAAAYCSPVTWDAAAALSCATRPARRKLTWWSWRRPMETARTSSYSRL